MIGKRRREKHVESKPVQEPVIETTAELVATESATTEQPVTPAVEQPVQEKANDETKAKKRRYLPAKELSAEAVILAIAPNPKQNRSNNKSYRLYELCYKDALGLTVAQYEKQAQERIAEAHMIEPKGRARRLLRWDVEHGHIQIGVPVKESQEAAAAE
jgi:hypothetical protein